MLSLAVYALLPYRIFSGRWPTCNILMPWDQPVFTTASRGFSSHSAAPTPALFIVAHKQQQDPPLHRSFPETIAFAMICSGRDDRVGGSVGDVSGPLNPKRD